MASIKWRNKWIKLKFEILVQRKEMKRTFAKKKNDKQIKA